MDACADNADPLANRADLCDGFNPHYILSNRSIYMNKLTQLFPAVVLGFGSLFLVTRAQEMDFGNMMNPSKWMGGGNNDRYYGGGPGYGGPGYGYGGPGYGVGPGYGYGGPVGYGPGPGYGYGGPGGYGPGPGYGGGPGYGYGGPGGYYR